MPNYDTIFNPKPIPVADYATEELLWQHRLGNYDVPAIQVLYNGSWYALPMHAIGLKSVTTTVVDSGRNANYVVIAQPIGRNQSKIDGLVFPLLYAHEWKKILTIFKEGFKRTIKYYDQERGMIYRKVYPGDRTAEVYAYKQDASGDVEIYKDCSVNLIDTGEEVTL